MSAGPDTPPFSTVDINNDSRDDEDIFASAVQEVSLDPEVNGAREGLEKVSIDDTPASISTSLNSPVMEEIATERSNNIIITVTEPQKNWRRHEFVRRVSSIHQNKHADI